MEVARSGFRWSSLTESLEQAKISNMNVVPRSTMNTNGVKLSAILTHAE